MKAPDKERQFLQKDRYKGKKTKKCERNKLEKRVGNPACTESPE